MELEEEGEVVAVVIVDAVIVDEIAAAVQDGCAVVVLDTWQAGSRAMIALPLNSDYCNDSILEFPGDTQNDAGKVPGAEQSRVLS